MQQMNFKKSKKWMTCFAVLLGLNLSAQQEQPEIKKEDVVVEFSFNPTLSNVFKLKSIPNPTEEFPKKTVQYQINSKEVASDFVPVAKKAVYVPIEKDQAKQYSSYVYGAYGLYGNGEFELMFRPEASRSGYQYGIDLSSYNAQNGIDDERVANGQWNAGAELFLSKQNRYSDWIARVNYQRNQTHWYGLDANVPETNYQQADVQQLYNKVDVSVEMSYQKAIVESIRPSIQLFSDAFDSSEANIQIATSFNKSLLADLIALDVDFQYLNGSFEQGYSSPQVVNYSFINAGITPKYNYQSDYFQLSAALGLFVNLDQEASKSNFVFLPKVQIDFPLVDEIMVLHGGIRSQLNQHTYASLSKENPWISSTQNIQTTRVPVDVFVGLDGKLTKTTTYAAEVSYQQAKDYRLFVNNTVVLSNPKAYEMGNSFTALYDDLSVFSFKGSVETNFVEKVTGGLSAAFNSYQTDQQDEAWNLPSFELETYVNYTYQKFFSQLGINYIGARKDFVNAATTTVDGFLDLNLKSNYAISNRFHVHLNLYNLFNNQYQSYQNYQVQGLQAVGGLSYKF